MCRQAGCNKEPTMKVFNRSIGLHGAWELYCKKHAPSNAVPMKEA